MSAVMVLGCTSWAGKSLVATALCRWYADQGLRVAPFKGQNMSNNARVVAGGELGVAQWLQARAARVEPEVRMGPVLVKPERDGSQVVVLGQVDDELSRLAWTARPRGLWGPISRSLDSLLAEHDLVVCEGAGSPAETNLRDTDLANLRVAAHAGAPALLVADIDRGGAFAHLLGTWLLVGEQDRHRLAGFVLNKFRGDATLLREAPAELAARTGMAAAGVLPMLRHRLPDEDGARDLTVLGPGEAGATAGGPRMPTVAVVRYPSASNLDELTLLATVSRLTWARTPAEVADADLVVLPGSKHVAADLAWLREQGLDRALVARAGRGGRVLGVCGGLQMLGRRLGPEPVAGAGGPGGPWPGLGLLPVSTVYARRKRVAPARGLRLAVPAASPWAALDGLVVDGYDVRHGTTVADRDAAAAGPAAGHPAPDAAAAGAPDDPYAGGEARPVLGEDHGWAAGAVLGLACHGVLEDPAVVEALLGVRPADTLEDTLAALGAAVEEHLDTDLLRRLTGGLL